MKTVLVVCGGGIATSTILRTKIDELLTADGIEHRLIQCSLNEMDSYLDEADLVVSSMKLFKELPVPCIVGTAFVTGVGEQEVADQILASLTA